MEYVYIILKLGPDNNVLLKLFSKLRVIGKAFTIYKNDNSVLKSS